MNQEQMIDNLISFIEDQNKDFIISSGIEIFLKHVKANKQPDTYRYYCKYLKKISCYLDSKNIKTFREITPYVLDDFVSFSKEHNNCNNTINKSIGALKTVSTYLVDTGILSNSIKYPKLKQTLKKIKILPSNDLIKILNYIVNLSLRDQIIVELIIQTGLRRTELCYILNGNIDLKNNSIYLSHTKTNSPRFIYFDDELKNKISILLGEKSFYFFTNTAQPLSCFVVDSIFKRMKKRLNIEMLSPHLLRHTFATFVLKNGGNIEEVRRLLGHSSYIMTQRYLHLLEDELKAASLKFNPKTLLTKKKRTKF